MCLTLAACAPSALAGTDPPAYGSITFEDERARTTFDAYLALLESDRATFASELATIVALFLTSQEAVFTLTAGHRQQRGPDLTPAAVGRLGDEEHRLVI